MNEQIQVFTQHLGVQGWIRLPDIVVLSEVASLAFFLYPFSPKYTQSSRLAEGG